MGKQLGKCSRNNREVLCPSASLFCLIANEKHTATVELVCCPYQSAICADLRHLTHALSLTSPSMTCCFSEFALTSLIKAGKRKTKHHSTSTTHRSGTRQGSMSGPSETNITLCGMLLKDQWEGHDCCCCFASPNEASFCLTPVSIDIMLTMKVRSGVPLPHRQKTIHSFGSSKFKHTLVMSVQ